MSIGIISVTTGDDMLATDQNSRAQPIRDRPKGIATVLYGLAREDWFVVMPVPQGQVTKVECAKGP